MNNTDNKKHPLISDPVRRRLLLGAAGMTGMTLFLGGGAIRLAQAAGTKTSSALLGFEPIAASTADEIVVAPGYRAEVLISWGDPLHEGGPHFDPQGANSAQEQALQFGDNADGMSLFAIDSHHAVMAVNNEYANNRYLFAHGGERPQSLEDVRKVQAATGVSLFAIERIGDSPRWQIDRGSSLNRRITANSAIRMSGPAAGHPLLQTQADPSGKQVLGTLYNCANGQTPWGTYLTCEENFDVYFSSSQADHPLSETQKRYGLKVEASADSWGVFDARFDVAQNPNEFHRHGWIVEIDPHDPDAQPVKRSALGRFKHENASLTLAKDGRVVVYMGDDERGEFIYKFVSNGRFDPQNPRANRELLDQGTLYVARFDAGDTPLKGKGSWLPLRFGQDGLTPENGFADEASVLIFARQAATLRGATQMDRPEWIAVNPHDGRTYCTLTNNHRRGQENMPINAVNPRANNVYGQIIRWDEKGDATSETFDWDMFALCGNPIAHNSGVYRGTPNITAENTFNSPDGLGFDKDGRLWILTDGAYSNQGDFAGQGNNQMLAGDPDSGEIRRFMVGPKSCELTGLAFAADYRTMFVNVQHPGEDGDSRFPANSPRPRASLVMITREDGGTIGAA